MKVSGKIIQIIKNKDIDGFMIYKWIRDEMIATGKDLIVILKPGAPTGFKGWVEGLNPFRKYEEHTWSILADATGIKVGEQYTADIKPFMVKCFCYKVVK